MPRPYSLEHLRRLGQVGPLPAQQPVWIQSTSALPAPRVLRDYPNQKPAQAFAISGLLSIVWMANPEPRSVRSVWRRERTPRARSAARKHHRPRSPLGSLRQSKGLRERLATTRARKERKKRLPPLPRRIFGLAPRLRSLGTRELHPGRDVEPRSPGCVTRASACTAPSPLDASGRRPLGWSGMPNCPTGGPGTSPPHEISRVVNLGTVGCNRRQPYCTVSPLLGAMRLRLIAPYGRLASAYDSIL